MKTLTLLCAVSMFTSLAHAYTVDEAKAVFASDAKAKEVFGDRAVPAGGISENDFDHKHIKLTPIETQLPPLEFDIHDGRVFADGQSLALHVEGNKLNLDAKPGVCDSLCLVFPVDLKKLEDVSPAILLMQVGYFGPAIPQPIPMVLEISEIATAPIVK